MSLHSTACNPEVPRGTLVYKNRAAALARDIGQLVADKVLAGKTAWVNTNGRPEEVVMCHSNCWRYLHPTPATEAACV